MIYFHYEDVDFFIQSPKSVIAWINQVVLNENHILGNLNIIFCSDAYLLQINQEYLAHNYFTDIITFDNSDNHLIEGDLFISTDRVSENASSLGINFIDELHRVIIHGVLHLLGYSDKDENSQLKMRERENHYLILRKF